jgi:hypothetical protein
VRQDSTASYWQVRERRFARFFRSFGRALDGDVLQACSVAYVKEYKANRYATSGTCESLTRLRRLSVSIMVVSYGRLADKIETM